MLPNVQSKQGIVVMLVLIQAAIYGLGNVLMKIAYLGVSPMWCAVLRFGLAFALFMLFFGRRVVATFKGKRLRTWLPSCLLMAASFLLCGLAVNLTSATNAGFFMALPMLFTPVLSLVVLRRAYTLQTVLLQGVVIAGLYLLCCNGGALSFGPGEFCGLASSACFAASIVMAEHGLGEVDAIAMSVAQIGITFVAATGAAIVFEVPPVLDAVPLESWAAIAFLAVIGTCVAFFLQNFALSRIPSATVSVLLCAEPVFTAAISAVALGEVLTSVGIVGAALIVACTMAASLEDTQITLSHRIVHEHMQRLSSARR